LPITGELYEFVDLYLHSLISGEHANVRLNPQTWAKGKKNLACCSGRLHDRL